MTEPIRLVDPDPRWPQLFQQERLRVAVALGVLAASFEHVGSTAIPGVSRSRPVIDLLVGLRPDASLDSARAKIGPVPPTHRIELATFDGEDWRDLVMFRDWLTLRADRARAYTALKVRLAEQHAGDLDRYRTGKAAFIAEVLEEAKRFPAKRLRVG